MSACNDFPKVDLISQGIFRPSPRLGTAQNLSSQLWSPMPSLDQMAVLKKQLRSWSLSRAKFEFYDQRSKRWSLVWLLLQNHLLGCSYSKKKSYYVNLQNPKQGLHGLSHAFMWRQLLDRKIAATPGTVSVSFFWIHLNLNHSQESRCFPSSKQPSKSPSTSQHMAKMAQKIPSHKPKMSCQLFAWILYWTTIR